MKCRSYHYPVHGHLAIRPRVPMQSYPPAVMAGLYAIPAGLPGDPPAVDLIELGGGYETTSLNAWCDKYGYAHPQIEDVSIDGGSNSYTGDPNGADGEVVLDICNVIGVMHRAFPGKPAKIRVLFAPNSNQSFLHAAQAVKNPCGISWGCYDSGTEVLTDDGWRYFSEIKGDEQIATLNPESNLLEYQPIQQVHRYPYKGQLHSYRGRCTDLLVTPNHQMYVSRRTGEAAKLIPSEEVFNDKRYHVPKTARWEGREIATVELAGHTIDADLFLEFLGYFLSEGWASIGETHHTERLVIKKRNHWAKRRRTNCGAFAAGLPHDPRVATTSTYVAKAFDETTYSVGLSQSKNQSYIDKIHQCLSKLPFLFNRNGCKWKCADKDLCRALAGFGKAHQKYIPSWIKTLCSRQLRILYDALMLGDGSRSETGKRAYYTSSKQLADDVQEVLLKVGFVGSIRAVDRRGRDNGAGGITRHVEYRVNIKEKYKTERLTKHTLVEYDDFVYCLTVPNHIMFVRRDGLPAWCGNSPEDQWDVPSMQAMDAAFAGKTVCCASGDNGSGDGETGQHADFPGSSPHAVCCGGTSILTSVVNGVLTITNESVWNGGSQGGAGGGGFSTTFPAPAYQTGFVPHGKGRGVPDLAAAADPASGWDTPFGPIGGTSAVAPFLAAYFAVVNATLASAGQEPITDPHSTMYVNEPTCFRDCVSGNNGAYSALKGWDAASGLGMPICTTLAAAFRSGVVAPPPVVPPPVLPPPITPPGTPPVTPPVASGPTLAQTLAAVNGFFLALESHVPRSLKPLLVYVNAQLNVALTKFWGTTGAARANIDWGPIIQELLPVLEKVLEQVIGQVIAGGANAAKETKP